MFVYVIGSDAGPHKVGISSNPVTRLASLQTAHHERLTLHFTLDCADAAAVERYTHAALRAHRLSGEWFDIDAQEAVAAVQAAAEAVSNGELFPKIEPEPIKAAFDLESTTPTPTKNGFLLIGAVGAMRRREANADAYRRLILGRG